MSEGYEDDYDDNFDEQSAGPPPTTDSTAASRLKVPAILLLVTAGLNLLVALRLLSVGYIVQNLPLEEFEKIMTERWTPEQRKQLEDAGYTMPMMKDLMVKITFGWGGAALVGSILTIIGGICMLRLKLRGLAILAALVNIVPCVGSPICLLAIPFGIWVLVVLLNPEVKQAFR